MEILMLIILSPIMSLFFNSLFRFNRTVFVLLCSVLVFLFVSFFIIFLGFEFLGLVFSTVYVGGIVVMFLFLILIVDVRVENTQRLLFKSKDFFYTLAFSTFFSTFFSLLFLYMYCPTLGNDVSFYLFFNETGICNSLRYDTDLLTLIADMPDYRLDIPDHHFDIRDYGFDLPEIDFDVEGYYDHTEESIKILESFTRFDNFSIRDYATYPEDYEDSSWVDTWESVAINEEFWVEDIIKIIDESPEKYTDLFQPKVFFYNNDFIFDQLFGNLTLNEIRILGITLFNEHSLLLVLIGMFLLVATIVAVILCLNIFN